MHHDLCTEKYVEIARGDDDCCIGLDGCLRSLCGVGGARPETGEWSRRRGYEYEAAGHPRPSSAERLSTGDPRAKWTLARLHWSSRWQRAESAHRRAGA